MFFTRIAGVNVDVGIKALIHSSLAEPRIWFAMARDGLVPSFLVQIHPRFHTPYNATLLSGGCATILTLMVDLEILAALTSAMLHLA